MPPGLGLAPSLQRGAGGGLALTITAVLLRAVGDPTGDAGAGDRGEWLAGGPALSRPTPSMGTNQLWQPRGTTSPG